MSTISKILEREDFDLATKQNNFYDQAHGKALVGVLLLSRSFSDGYHFDEKNEVLHRRLTEMMIAVDENNIIKLSCTHTKPEDCVQADLPIGSVIYASPVYISGTKMVDFLPNFGEGVQFGRYSGMKIYRWRTILCFNNEINIAQFLVNFNFKDFIIE